MQIQKRIINIFGIRFRNIYGILMIKDTVQSRCLGSKKPLCGFSQDLDIGGATSYMEIVLIDIRDTFTNSSSGAEDNVEGLIRLR